MLCNVEVLCYVTMCPVIGHFVASHSRTTVVDLRGRGDRIKIQSRERPLALGMRRLAYILHSEVDVWYAALRRQKLAEEREMIMGYTHILAPTDFSDPANHALSLAFEEAAMHTAKVTLLYVLHHEPETEVYYIQGSPTDRRAFAAEFGGVLPMEQQPEPHTFRRDHIEEALTHLRELVPRSFSGTWEAEVATGEPATEIVRMAQDRDANLIVMGTHGRTGLRRTLLGSVAEHVVRHTPCPILIVRHSDH
jgi:nucleotide-binding universal stress UspA family protein